MGTSLRLELGGLVQDTKHPWGLGRGIPGSHVKYAKNAMVCLLPSAQIVVCLILLTYVIQTRDTRECRNFLAQRINQLVEDISEDTHPRPTR